ncbi:hypothetical protein LBMAG24_08990 [Bacteroidota bacterium]|nr:hypothetical protein LBMAG24_08990 [Bacteroidota bacterium]
MAVLELLGKSHLLWVHLPIGFIFLALVLTLLKWKNPEAPYLILLPLIWRLATLAAIFSVLSGLLLSENQEGANLFFHQYAGIFLTMGLITYLIFNKNFILIFIGILFVITIHLGASLTHGEDYLFTEKWKVITQLNEVELYEDAIVPIFKAKCFSCHKPGKSKGDLDLTNYEKMGDKAELVRRTHLPKSHKEFMPSNGKAPLSKEQLAILSYWVEIGAPKTKRLAQLQLDAKRKALFESFFKLNENPLLSLNVKSAKYEHLAKNGFLIQPIYQQSALLEVKYTGKGKPDLKLLQEVKKQVVWLDLSNTGLRNEDLKIVGQLENLFKLNLSKNDISNQGILALGGLKNLTDINLYETQVNAAALNHLLKLPKIQRIYVWETKLPTNYLDSIAKINPTISLIYER